MKKTTLFAACIGAASLLTAASASAQDCRTAAMAGSWTWATLDNTCFIDFEADGTFRGRCRNVYYDDAYDSPVLEVFRVRGTSEVDSECRLTGVYRVIGEPGNRSPFVGRVWGITSNALVAGNVAFTRPIAPGGGVMLRD